MTWCTERRCGLHFSSQISVQDWMANPVNREQRRVDRAVAVVKAGAVPLARRRPPRREARPVLPMADDLRQVSRLLELLGDALASDPALVSRAWHRAAKSRHRHPDADGAGGNDGQGAPANAASIARLNELRTICASCAPGQAPGSNNLLTPAPVRRSLHAAAIGGAGMFRASLTESFFPAVRDAPVEPLTIGDLLRRQARAHADTVALKEIGYDGAIGRSWTYADLLADAERLGRALASRHRAGRAHRGLRQQPSRMGAASSSGCALAGLTLVTVNPAYQKRELKYVLEQSRSEAVYYVEEFRGSPMQAIADEACAELPAIRHRILLTDHAALFDGEDRGVLPAVAPGDVTQIQYTSGTTGFPKGALLHHHGLIQNARDMMARLGLGAGDVFMHNMPLFHTTGCAICVLGIIDAGATHAAGADVRSGDDRAR